MRREDEMYMRRCLQLARCGRNESRPNPMVGAVIVADGRIIGEGYHVRCGEGHAEVNAFASVRPEDEPLLPQATIYVSLEPCSHWGKTPPCCDLIVKKGVRRVVVGCVDDFAKVQGRGIARLREAGIEVTVGVLEEECRWLNRRFLTFHREHRPWIVLKWAQTADGYIDDGGRALKISTPVTQRLVHKLRAEEDAIVVGRTTWEREQPQLNVRLWAGKSPERFVLGGATASQQGVTAVRSIDELLEACRERELQSLIVEGGRKTLQSFLDRGLWDEMRVEEGRRLLCDGEGVSLKVEGTEKGTCAPQMPVDLEPDSVETVDGNRIAHYFRRR